MFITEIITYVVAISTWLTPMQGPNTGWIVRYNWNDGPNSLVEMNADWHGYDLDRYRDRCGFATMSPSNLGHVGWFWNDKTKRWYGPCLAIDVSAFKDFYDNVYVRGEVAEVGTMIADELDFIYGEPGVIYMGMCPPKTPGKAKTYWPKLQANAWHGADNKPMSRFPYPEQQYPIDCRPPLERMLTACGEAAIKDIWFRPC